MKRMVPFETAMKAAEVTKVVAELSREYAGDEQSLADALGDLLFVFRDGCGSTTISDKIGKMLDVLDAKE